MPTNKDLDVFLCVENVDNCDILLNQLGNGEIFGPNQHLRLILQSFQQNQLEALSWDVQDCAFPLISDVSTCTTLADAGLHPDAIMVLLTDHLKGSCNISNLDEDQEYFKDFLGLIQYTKSLAKAFAGCSLNHAPIVLLGDSSHTVASLLSNHLSTVLDAGQMIALDGIETNLRPRKLGRSQGHMGKVVRFCDALRQWWNGQQAHPDIKTKLGTKFVDNKQRCVNGESTGYFFSAPVDFSGPGTFSARLDCNIDLSHVARVKAETDAAHALVAKIYGHQCEQEQSSCFPVALL
ncbi:hypothetical protein RRG08_032079 [Elysia crispata]|uniref:Uncharacterized protein n=1 Tax=Elysia crispata TaxID=231223 RepID=A0AAE0ZH49_9GAST|nr:hypothetical protein RRG08_032079 [Elysia crispata]